MESHQLTSAYVFSEVVLFKTLMPTDFIVNDQIQGWFSFPSFHILRNKKFSTTTTTINVMLAEIFST